MQILLWVIVGWLTGWATGKRMKGHGYGPLVDVVMGIAGALGGGFMMRAAGYSGIYTIVVAVLCSGALTSFAGFASGKGRYAHF